jgi:signal transduction histidine kinase
MVVSESIRLIVGRANVQRVCIKECVPLHSVLIDADKEQLRQVLLNLLLNALDAMPTGGELSVSLFAAIGDPHTASGCGDGADVRPSPDQRITLVIADSGCGLPPDLEERVFEPFVTSKANGTGLGLSICKRIVEAHGGLIRAANRPQHGTEFSIQLPACCT